jgi:hypothetical protein
MAPEQVGDFGDALRSAHELELALGILFSFDDLVGEKEKKAKLNRAKKYETPSQHAYQW